MADSKSDTARLQRFELKTLYETSRLLNDSLDLDFVLGNLLLIAMSKMLVTRGVALLHEPMREAYRVVTVKGIRGLEPKTFLPIELPRDEDLWCDDDVPDLLAEHRLALVLPVVYHGRRIGLVAFGRKPGGVPCEGEELEFLKSVVNMASAAVHNSLMVEELQAANRDLDAKIQELNTLFDLSQEFNATRDRDRLLKLLTFALMGQLLVQRHLFLLRRPKLVKGEPVLHVVAAQAIPDTDFSVDLCERLSDREDLLVIESDDDPIWEELRVRGLKLVLPLRLRGRTEGVLAIGPKMTQQPYQPGDIEFLYALGNLALTSIQNTFLLEEQLEKERLEEEMRLARQIQERLLPEAAPVFEGLDIASYATPSLHVAGDYLDLIKLTDDRFLVAIADVTGKGVPAALLMANIQACLRMVSPIEITLEEATARINRVIHENTGYDKFITFFWGLFTRSVRSFSYINAGHEPPFHISANGEIERLEQGGLLLGVFSSAEYERGVATLAPGDVMVLFTDGVNEAMDPEQNQYGEERLQAVIVEHRHVSAQEILDALLEDVHLFTQGAAQSDDLTVIVLKAD